MKREFLKNFQVNGQSLPDLDTSDVDKFKAAVDTMVGKFPAITRADEVPPPYAAGTGTGSSSFINDPIAAAFRPKD